ncbi:AbrB/MazE/SpoVT family DNA-binding domain-containing protein [Aneurinibacillus terranovensis]|uniref:AbrB/MazE/SpoVT family DNA-binding domain-containing protein n=1 Tax=Aneurinibacillus terranovensis TaxID=278991 RepID=UPI00041D9213|nr:AbrB/MazE/SpoVT family DNA-binding domain-containing protein [Aneurinibacillus terranovensis]
MDFSLRSESEIKQRYQTTIPKEIREKAKLDVGDELIWKYDQISDEIIVIRKPKKFSDAFWGLGKELWEKENGDEYIRKEREGWE